MSQKLYQRLALHRSCALFALALCFPLLLAGCLLPDGDISHIHPYSSAPRVGKVYLVRGLLGIWSSGLDRIAQQLQKEGISANVYQDAQWPTISRELVARYKGVADPEPLVLVGHSFGADHVIDLARNLRSQNITVDLLITIDPVQPHEVPGNVRACYNFFQSNGIWDRIPAFRGVPLVAESGVPLQNYDLRSNRTDLLQKNTTHFNIEKNPKVRKEVIKLILPVCPPRDQWRPPSSQSASTQPAPITPATSR